jgi:hypothetical protein
MSLVAPKCGPGSSAPGGAIPEGGTVTCLLPRCVRPALRSYGAGQSATTASRFARMASSLTPPPSPRGAARAHRVTPPITGVRSLTVMGSLATLPGLTPQA